MTKLTVIGGTGYAGTNIVRHAAERGLEVTSVSRKAPADRVPGVTYVEGDVLDPSVLERAVDGADVVVSALSPRGALEGHVREVDATLATLAAKAGVRLGVIGGAGSLLVAPGGPKVSETDGFPAAILPEATEMGTVLDDLRAGDGSLDWFYVSPAGGFGAFAPGEATGHYRVGGDVLLVDDNGDSNISGSDFGLAVVDEITTPAHHRERFTVAY